MSSYIPKIFSTTLLLVMIGQGASAHPVSFKGGHQLEITASESVWMTSLHRSYSARQAYGAQWMHLDGHGVDKHAFSLQHNWLGKRWFLPHAQANFYYGVGLGYSSTAPDGRDSLLGNAFVQLDYETRRIYTAWKTHFMVDELGSISIHSAAVGFAPYLAEYDELNTWLLLRAEYSDGFADDIEIIPTLRFFYSNYFWEVGIDTDGRLRAMFMAHF